MKFGSAIGLPALAIAEGASMPVPVNGAGSLVFSTSAVRLMVWTGLVWTSGISPFAITQVEIDFGTSGTSAGRTFVITDSNAVVGKKVLASQAGDAPTGKGYDEAEVDPLIVAGSITQNGFINLTVTCGEAINYLVAKYKLNYSLG